MADKGECRRKGAPMTDAEVGWAVRRLWARGKYLSIIKPNRSSVLVSYSPSRDPWVCDVHQRRPTLDAALRAALAAMEERG